MPISDAFESEITDWRAEQRHEQIVEELIGVLQLALFAHGKVLLTDPPQDAWNFYQVEGKALAAIAKATGKEVQK